MHTGGRRQPQFQLPALRVGKLRRVGQRAQSARCRGPSGHLIKRRRQAARLAQDHIERRAGFALSCLGTGLATAALALGPLAMAAACRNALS